MDTLEQRRENIDASWFKETEAEVTALSGKDRFGNWWQATAQYDHMTEMWQPKMTSRVNLFDGSYWNVSARTPDEAINTLIADGKYTPL